MPTARRPPPAAAACPAAWLGPTGPPPQGSKEGPQREVPGRGAGHVEHDGGGAGNRTRVLRRLVRASPSAARYASTRPHRSHERVGVTGPVAVSSRRPDPATGSGRPVPSLMPVTGSGTIPDRQTRYPPQAARAKSARFALALIVFRRPINESTSASSARFPCRNARSRNLSPPLRRQAAPNNNARGRPRHSSFRHSSFRHSSFRHSSFHQRAPLTWRPTARWISRSASRRARSCRLSYDRFPRASASSTLAQPSAK